MNFSNFYNNFTLKINNTFDCYEQQTFKDMGQFFECYQYFFKKSMNKSIAQWIIIICTVLFNGLVMLLTIKNSTKFSIFDQILFGHSIVDGLTGLIDIPLFHVNDIFGYWPFGNSLGFAWAIYDNNINTTTSLHMAYASYVRLRSILNPKGYKHELLFRKPYLVMLSIWAVDLTIWAILAFTFGLNDYSKDIEFRPFYIVSILNFILWFLPLILIFCLSIFVYDLLRKRELKRRLMAKRLSRTIRTALSFTPTFNQSISQRVNLRKKSNKLKLMLISLFHPSPKFRFSVLMGSYWIQWFPPCLITIISPYIANMDETFTSAIYWLTYSVCMTDPLFILMLNPNVSLCKSKIK